MPLDRSLRVLPWRAHGGWIQRERHEERSQIRDRGSIIHVLSGHADPLQGEDRLDIGYARIRTHVNRHSSLLSRVRPELGERTRKHPTKEMREYRAERSPFGRRAL